MLKYLDIILCSAAWLLAIASFIALFPPYNKGAWLFQLNHFQIPWAICIVCLAIFRNRPWRELWGVWLSALVIFPDYYDSLFVGMSIVALIWMVSTLSVREIFQRSNLDYAFGVMAWASPLGVMLSGWSIFTWDQTNYMATYGPLAWVACMVGLLVFRKHPWRQLWWVLPSGLMAFPFWLMVIMVIIATNRPG